MVQLIEFVLKSFIKNKSKSWQR